MTNHQIQQHVTEKEPHRYKATCKCRKSSAWVDHRWQAEDWAREHIEQVNRVRANLESKNPSLAGQADYYRSKADDATLDKAERAQWRDLADQVDRRLGRGESRYADDLPLF